MTDGVGARYSKTKDNLIYQRKKNSLLASKILGFKWLWDYCGNFPDNGMDKVNLLDVVKIIEKTKKKLYHILFILITLTI